MLDVVHGPCIARIVSEHRIAKDILRLFAKFSSDDLAHAIGIELVDGAEEAEDENVLTARLRAAADRLDGRGGEGDSDVDDAALVFDLFYLIAVVEADAAVFERLEVVVVGVLIKGDQGVRFVPGVEDIAGAEVDLEDGRPSGNGGGDRHVGHHLLSGRASELA